MTHKLLRLQKDFDDFCSKKLGFQVNIELSLSKLNNMSKNENIYLEFEKTFAYLEKRTNHILYWLSRGYSLKDSYKNSKIKGWKKCKICKKTYLNGYNFNTCSEVCYKESRILAGKNISKAKKLYNHRDPVQYASKHNISLSEAEDIVKNFCKSPFQKSHWISKGYTEEEAKSKVSEIQSRNSPRSKLYWIKKGYTEEEAKSKVSEIQKNNAEKYHQNVNKQKIQEKSCFSILYWIKKGYTEEEAKSKVSEIQKNNAEKYHQNTSNEIKRQNLITCIEYWKKRYPETYMEEYEKYLSDRFSNSFYRSKKADNFFEKLNLMLEDKIDFLQPYYGNKEFGKYDEDIGYIKYDWVSEKIKLCIEYNGNYWHANPSIYSKNETIRFPNKTEMKAKDIWEKDKRKNKVLEKIGYKVLTVWEKDIDDNIDKEIQKIIDFIEERIHYENNIN